jgi:hypothetical protein
MEKPLYYERLSAKELARRMAESFTSVYLTLISIIQATALYLLCQQTVTSELDFLTALYTLMSFATIVGVSYEYNWFVGVHRWPQKFFDTLIPLALGFWEILAIYNLTHPRYWWLMIGIFTLVGAAAYWNTWANCKPEMFEDNDGGLRLCKSFKSNTRYSIILALITSVLSFAFFMFYVYMKRIWFAVDLPMAAVYIGLFTSLIWKDTKFLSEVNLVLFKLEQEREEHL